MAKRRRKVAQLDFLDKLIGRAILVSESFRKEFTDRLAEAIAEVGMRDEARVIAVTRAYLAAYNPLFAEHLSNAMILTWLGGYLEQVDNLPELVKRWMRDHRFWDQLPPEVPGIFGPGAKSPKAVRFPRIEKATESLFKRGLMTRPQYDRLTAAAKQATFTVAWIDDTAVIGKIRDALAETIAEGPTLDRFREKVEERLEASPLSPWHSEVIYRTNLMSAYRDGKESLLQHPIVQEVFPFREYVATHDGRVRDEHLALETLGIQGTGIYYSTDPVWDYFSVPWDYNCRCVTIPLRIADAARAGIEEAKEWLRTGVKPANPTYCLAKIPFRPKPGFGVRHGPLLSVGTASSVRMSAQPIRLGDVNPWVPFPGPRGGKRWRNIETGAKRYQKERPGAHETGGTSKASVHGVSALPVRGQHKPGGVVRPSQRQAAAAGQALPQTADARVGQGAAGVVPTQRPEAGVIANMMKRTRETGMEHGALFGPDGRQIGATVVGRHKDQEGFGYQGVQVTTTAEHPDGMTKVHTHPGVERPSKADYLDFFGDTKLSRSMILLGDGSRWEMTRTKATGDIAGHDVRQAWLRAEEDLIIDEGLESKDEQFTDRLFAKLEPMTGVHVEHVKGGSSAASKPQAVAAEHDTVGSVLDDRKLIEELGKYGYNIDPKSRLDISGNVTYLVGRGSVGKKNRTSVKAISGMLADELRVSALKSKIDRLVSEGAKVRETAFRKHGAIYTSGPIHLPSAVPGGLTQDVEAGFVTNTGEFLNREEAGLLVDGTRMMTGERLQKIKAEQKVSQSAPPARQHVAETAEFKRWFAGSKVVDADGKPIVVYHGSDSEISEFRPLTHFGTSKAADNLVRRGGFGEYIADANIYPVYLAIKRPFRIKDSGRQDDSDSIIMSVYVAGGLTRKEWQGISTVQQFIDIMRGKGYDGLVYRNDIEDDSDSWIVFDASQIKSATGNRGTFDPDDPDIRMAI